MLLIPAIDIKQGKCVRLLQGDENKVTFYGNPVEMALKWQAEGAGMLHIVDLDGAFSGESGNRGVIEEIIDGITIPIQIGGGIRDYDLARDYLQMGAARVIFGTAAVSDPLTIKKAVADFGERIAVGIDGRNGAVALKGWVEQTSVATTDLAMAMEDIGVQCLIWTDIATDGTLRGPNLSGLQEFMKDRKAKVIASGGIGSDADILSLRDTGVYGAIIGKALYAGKVNLRQTLEVENVN